MGVSSLLGVGDSHLYGGEGGGKGAVPGGFFTNFLYLSWSDVIKFILVCGFVLRLSAIFIVC